MKVVIGVACDKKVRVRDINANLVKDKAVYIPDEEYLCSNPIPDAWFELFHEYQGLEEPKIDLLYTPVISSRELKAM
jgi:hypothetical protein